ncbi:MAG: hypothetical protein V4598_03145 [Bdellovibrionota bacterium]
MKFIFILLSLYSFSAMSALNTEISCEMKRDEYDKMGFEFKFLTPKRAISLFHFQKGEETGSRNSPVSAIHESSEARYVGINFLSDEKLVFIFLSPMFSVENLGIPYDIEVVSSIYGPVFVKCKATK